VPTLPPRSGFPLASRIKTGRLNYFFIRVSCPVHPDSPFRNWMLGSTDEIYFAGVSKECRHDLPTSHAMRSNSRGRVYVRFRAWRERHLPDASYQIAPAFWTSAGSKYAASVEPILVPAVKRREPQLTGLAHTERAIYLVVVARAATYEHVARLIHCRALMRDDPDYQEHRGKRVSMLMLCDECAPGVADFAHRQRVRTLTTGISRSTYHPPTLSSSDE